MPDSQPPDSARTAELLDAVELRPIGRDDLPFLSRLYASTREEEMKLVPWSEEQKREFLQWQFEAQHAHYAEHYPDCDFLLIERTDGAAPRPVGRLYVDRWDDEIRLVDIALIPEERGRGLGSALLRRILDEGREKGLPVRIHVEYNNPALRLYRRLGFHHVDSNGVYYLMEWTPGAG